MVKKYREELIQLFVTGRGLTIKEKEDFHRTKECYESSILINSSVAAIHHIVYCIRQSQSNKSEYSYTDLNLRYTFFTDGYDSISKEDVNGILSNLGFIESKGGCCKRPIGNYVESKRCRIYLFSLTWEITGNRLRVTFTAEDVHCSNQKALEEIKSSIEGFERSIEKLIACRL